MNQRRLVPFYFFRKDSNPHNQNQNLMCYHYTTKDCFLYKNYNINHNFCQVLELAGIEPASFQFSKKVLLYKFKCFSFGIWRKAQTKFFNGNNSQRCRFTISIMWLFGFNLNKTTIGSHKHRRIVVGVFYPTLLIMCD